MTRPHAATALERKASVEFATTAAVEEGEPHPALAQPRRTIAIAAVLAAMAAVVIDAGMSNAALPTIAASLGVSPAAALHVVTAYQTALVMALLPCAALAERFGYRRVFAWGAGLFTAASVVCALSPSLPLLAAAKFCQGLGGAAILALGVALLRFSVSDNRLGAAIGWNALTVALAAAAGPAIGALILSQANWPWLYAANLPLGVAAMLAARALPSVAGAPRRLDFISMALVCSVFGLLTPAVGISLTAPALACALLASSALALIMLVRREAPKTHPLVPLDLLRSSSFRVSVMASVLCFAGQTAALVALPFYLQHGLEQPPTAAALYMTAWPAGVAATVLLTGGVANRASTAWLCVLGGAILAVSLAAAGLWPLRGDPRLLALFSACAGVGFGFFQVANNRNMFLSAPRARSGAAGAAQGTARVTGQTAGALIATFVFVLAPLSMAPRATICLGAALTLAAGLLSAARRGSS